MVSSAKVWIAIGLFGQIFFFCRFLVQWIASEKAKRSVIPLSFWYMSIVGGLIVLAYSIYRKDPVFILGQAFGIFVYLRNLWLIYQHKMSSSS